jgi:uncharacterized protein (DUF3084 family)
MPSRPLLESIHKLTEQNNNVMQQLVAAHEEKMRYFNQVMDLQTEVARLTKVVGKLNAEIACLKSTIEKLTK